MPLNQDPRIDKRETYYHKATIRDRENFLRLERDWKGFGDEDVVMIYGLRDEDGLEVRELQAVEFWGMAWTEKGAKKWLTDHDLDATSFKKATVIDSKEPVLRFDTGAMGETIVTDEGYLKATPIVTRTGIFRYLNEDGSERRELRHPDDVFNFDSLSSMKMIPVTNGHPRERHVNADSSKRLSVGHTGESIVPDGKYVRSSVVITDGKAVEAVKKGRNQLSLGYQVSLIQEDGFFGGEAYDHRQTDIRYNHLAIVDQARAGNSASLHIDSAEIDPIKQKQKQTQTQGGNMPAMVKITLDGIEYDAQPEVKNALTKALGLNKDSATNVDAITVERDKAVAERDDLKAKLDEAEKKLQNTDGIQEAVKARLALVETARKVLDEAEHEKIDGMTDAEVKNAVIAKRHPEAKLDGQSEAYIQARFDAVAEDVKKDKSGDKTDATADQKKKLGTGENTDGDELDADKARDRMVKRNTDAWKGDQK